MTEEDFNTTALLDELTDLAPDARVSRLEIAGDIEPILMALGDEAEGLIGVELARAVRAAQLVVDLSDRIGTPKSRIRARRAMGRALSFSSRFEEAIAACDEAVAIAEDEDESVEAARIRMVLNQAHAELGELDLAMQAGEAARSALADAGETALAARADINLGSTYLRAGDPEHAVACFDRARPHLLDDPVILAHLDSNRGEALLKLDDLLGAESAFVQALHWFSRAGLHWAQAIVEGNLADLSTRRGNLQQALFHFEHARRHLEQDESPGHLARIIAEQAEAKAQLGMLEDALSDYKESLPQLQEQGLATEAARAEAALGQVMLRLGRLTEADEALDQAAAAHESLGDQNACARVNLLRAELAIQSDHLDEARTHIDSALDDLKHRPLDTAIAQHHLASLALMRGDVAGAITAIDDAIEIAENLNVAPLLADLVHTRGLICRESGDLSAAIEDFRRAVAHVERVRGTLQANRFRAAFLGDRLRVYESLVTALLDRRDDATNRDAFDAIELAKSRSLLDLVQGVVNLDEIARNADDRRDDDAALLAEMAECRSALNNLYRRGDLDARVGERSWSDAVGACEDRLAELENRLVATRGVASLYTPPRGLDIIQSELSADSALIEYFTAGDELLALVVRPDRLHVVRHLTDTDSLADLIRRVQFQFGRATRPDALSGERGERLVRDAQRDLDALSDAVLRPLDDAIDSARRLIIVPHGPLHTIPFSALRRHGRYLIESHEIVLTPSANLISHVAGTPPREAALSESLVLGVADEFAPRVADEARQIAALLGTERLLLDGDATAEETIRQAESAAIIHCACHGRFDPRSPLASGLRLGDRWLTVRDIYQLRLRASLVTLSACETGRNVIGTGDELTGLVRGFLAAGARSLLVSLWRVNDETTVELMRSFYNTCYHSHLEAPSRVAALRSAQLEALQRHPHPVLWAPFVLVGDP